MAVNDVYEVVDVQSLHGQEILNVYFYQQRAAFVPSAGNIATALAEGFSEQVVPFVAACQSGDLLHIETRVRNLFNPVDAGSFITGVAGTGSSGAAQTMPSFTAWGFTLKHDNPSVRPGSKRVAGVDESNQDDGIPSLIIMPALDALAEALAAPIEGGIFLTDDIMFPVVVKRVRTGAPGAYEYVLPDNAGDLTVGKVLEALVKLFVTSQVSRKYGVGV